MARSWQPVSWQHLFILSVAACSTVSCVAAAGRQLMADTVSTSTVVAVGVGSGLGGFFLASVLAALLFWLWRKGKLCCLPHRTDATAAAFRAGAYTEAQLSQQPTNHSLAGQNGSMSVQGGRELATHSRLAGTGSSVATQQTPSTSVAPLATQQDVAKLSGLPATDPFLTEVSLHYRWIAQTPPGAAAVEEGVNAASKRAKASGLKWKLPNDAPGPPPEQLTSSQVQQQLALVANGLIGQGATSVVFKGVWPSKFGSKGLVAVKCLRALYGEGADPVEQAFAYEAGVLERYKHANLVRLYGYCLERPTVCIIMELLPTTLMGKLHGWRCVPGSELVSQLVSPGPSQRLVATMSAGTENILPFLSNIVPGPTSGASLAPGGAGPSGGYDSGSCPTSEINTGNVLTLPLSGGSIVLGATPAGPPPSLLPPLEVLQLATGIVAGLAHLHAPPETRAADAPPVELQFQVPRDDGTLESIAPQLVRVAHRDLKPSNVLINSKGVAKICNFGLAREHASTTVATERHMGTVRYMAPELLEGNPVVRLTDKIDVYSLGVILWEIGMRTVPWDGCADMQVAQSVQQSKRPPLPGFKGPTGLTVDPPADSVFKAVPHYSAVINSCWQAQPQRRPKAAVVLNMMVRLLEQQQAAGAAAGAAGGQ